MDDILKEITIFLKYINSSVNQEIFSHNELGEGDENVSDFIEIKKRLKKISHNALNSDLDDIDKVIETLVLLRLNLCSSITYLENIYEMVDKAMGNYRRLKEANKGKEPLA